MGESRRHLAATLWFKFALAQGAVLVRIEATCDAFSVAHC